MPRKRGRSDTAPSGSSAPDPPLAAITRLSSAEFASLPPGHFYRNFVTRRLPCIIDSLLPEPELTVGAWTLAGIAARARASDTVFVEHRDAASRTFGTGVKTSMPLRDAMVKIGSGDREDLYLTTQPIEDTREGFPRYLYAQPLIAMEGTFTLRPALMGSLLPANINVWAGCSRSGASSNLHHDFHDNLYILLQGRKVFTIASPQFARRMYTHGSITRVHDSGIINYRGLRTRPDGCVVDEDEDGDSSGEAETPTAPLHPSTVFKRARGARTGADEAKDMWAALEAEAAALRLPTAVASGRSMPDHFSCINLPHLRSTLPPPISSAVARDAHIKDALSTFSGVQQHPEVSRTFPDFGTVPLITFELRAGQMLYLPAGWFHEVVSFSDVGDAPSPHLALNYWYYAPSRARMEEPYEDDTWARVHASMLAAHADTRRRRDGGADSRRGRRRGR